MQMGNKAKQIMMPGPEDKVQTTYLKIKSMIELIKNLTSKTQWKKPCKEKKVFVLAL